MIKRNLNYFDVDTYLSTSGASALELANEIRKNINGHWRFPDIDNLEEEWKIEFDYIKGMGVKVYIIHTKDWYRLERKPAPLETNTEKRNADEMKRIMMLEDFHPKDNCRYECFVSGYNVCQRRGSATTIIEIDLSKLPDQNRGFYYRLLPEITNRIMETVHESFCRVETMRADNRSYYRSDWQKTKELCRILSH